MTAADIYESAKERIRAVLPVPDSSRVILVIQRLKRLATSDFDQHALGVLLATIDRLAADLLEARLEIAALSLHPAGAINPEWKAFYDDEYSLQSWHRTVADMTIEVQINPGPDGVRWVINHPHTISQIEYCATPRQAMRAAEEELSKRGLL